MSYVAISDILVQLPEKQFISLLDDEATKPAVYTGNSNIATRANAIITLVDGLIDENVGGRYSVPLSPVPSIIKQIALDIVIYRLYKRRINTENDNPYLQPYRDGLAYLEALRNGKESLIELTPLSDSLIVVNKTAEDRLFSKEVLSGY